MNMNGRTNVSLLIVTAVIAALLAVMSQLSIPMPSGVPVTLQTFAVALCGYMLGKKYGLLSMIVYLLVGAVGAPVFQGFSGGLGRFAGMTGGYLWGFVPMAVMCGLGITMAGKSEKPAARAGCGVLFGVIGLALCHVCGVVQFCLVSGNGLIPSFLIASAPYLVKDVLSVAAAWFLAGVLKNSLSRAGIAWVRSIR